MEYACCVWDCAAPTVKARLDRIQRVALLAMTGAARTTSVQGLEATATSLLFRTVETLSKSNMHNAPSALRLLIQSRLFLLTAPRSLLLPMHSLVLLLLAMLLSPAPSFVVHSRSLLTPPSLPRF